MPPPPALNHRLALGHVLLRERHLLGGYRDARRLRAGAWRRRAEIQERRRRLAAPARRRATPRFGLRAPE